MPLVRELPRENDVTVEDRTSRIRDRIVEVVTLDEDGIEPGHRPLAIPARALEELRQEREHRRRIAPGRRWLAPGQTDLTLGHRDPRQRIHE